MAVLLMLIVGTNAFTTTPSSQLPPSLLPRSLTDNSFNLVVLGDLHMEDDMTFHNQARADCIQALKDLSLMTEREDDESMLQKIRSKPAGELSVDELQLLLLAQKKGDMMNCHLVSVGDLGRKDIRHEPGDAGTTKSFEDARNFLQGFRGIPLELVSGNHDLEGLDEFDTDEANLQAWLDCFDKPHPQFVNQVGQRTLLIGLSTVRFRDAPHSSHEVHVDDAQLKWFVDTVEQHPAIEGWKIIVFSHAPPMGSGLRVLQNVHVRNGCAWLNHCSSSTRKVFLQTVTQNPQIKLWFSGHFHLSHDYQDAINTVGSCTFVQVGVIGPKSSRDGKRQTRIVRGSPSHLEIYTINHHLRRSDGKADVRLDAHIDIKTTEVTLAHNDHDDFDRQEWFQAYTPRPLDGCYLEAPDGLVKDEVCWWHMEDGAVLGLHQGQLVEYDSETLAPLGIVVAADDLGDRQVYCLDGQAIVLSSKDAEVMQVIHPNQDGSYWRKFQRNKRVRMEEKAREEMARKWLEHHNQQ